MTDPTHNSETALRTIAVPFFVFASSLTVLLFLAATLYIPRLTRVEVSGVARSVPDMRAYRAELVKERGDLEQRREWLAAPLHDAAYDALKRVKTSQPSLLSIEHMLQQAGTSVSSQPDAVHLSRILYLSRTGELTVEGDVRFVGTRSMTLLAQFVDALKGLPFVASLVPPNFTRDEDPRGDLHSPFLVHLTLTHGT